MNWWDVVTGGSGAVLVVTACVWLRSWLRREFLTIDGFDPENPRGMKPSHSERKNAR